VETAPAVTVAEGASVEIAGDSAQSVTFTGTTGTLKLDHSLHAFFADYHRQTDIEIRDAIGAIDMDGAGQYALLVLEIAFGHGDRRGGRGVIG